MKTKIVSILLMICVFCVVTVFAQQTERELKREIKDKAVKEARKEAKGYKKQGYYVAPGAIPIFYHV